MNTITLDKSSFDFIKECIGDDIKSQCEFCAADINRETFGYFSMNVTACNNHLCSVQAMIKDEEEDE